MKIAHVTDCYLPQLGGIEIQVYDLATQQIAVGHDVQVLTSTPDRRPATSAASDQELQVESADALVPVSRFPGGTSWMPLPTSLSRLRKAIASGGFDAVHIHSSVVSPFAWAGARFAAQLGVPAVVTMHSVMPAGGRLLRASDSVGRWGKWPVVWTAVSAAAAGPLQHVLKDTEVRILSNGIAPEAWFTPEPRSSDAELTMISVMRLSQRKRPMPLLRIMAGVRQAIPATVPLRAVVIGAGPQQPRLQHYLNRSGMNSWVTLTGRLSRAEIHPLLSDADVYLAPAERESFGIAALEARCAGLPVVAMAKGGVGEFIRNGQEGYLVGSDAEMIRATADLLRSDGLRAMQERNRSSIPEMTWTKVVARSIELYREAGLTAAQGLSTLESTNV